jgi:hypothetical protein
VSGRISKKMDDREKLIREKIRIEDLVEMAQLKGISEEIREILIREKGFAPEEIEINPAFRIKLANCSADITIDLAINLSATYFMVIKCVTTAVESWERYVISFARAAKDYQIPYAAITDGKNIRIFDAISGSLVCESFDRLFHHTESMSIISNFKKIDHPEKNLEREKRIIYAFENIKCSPLEQDK